MLDFPPLFNWKVQWKKIIIYKSNFRKTHLFLTGYLLTFVLFFDSAAISLVLSSTLSDPNVANLRENQFGEVVSGCLINTVGVSDPSGGTDMINGVNYLFTPDCSGSGDISISMIWSEHTFLIEFLMWTCLSCESGPRFLTTVSSSHSMLPQSWVWTLTLTIVEWTLTFLLAYWSFCLFFFFFFFC